MLDLITIAKQMAWKDHLVNGYSSYGNEDLLWDNLSVHQKGTYLRSAQAQSQWSMMDRMVGREGMRG